jgi:hypothetical protein
LKIHISAVETQISLRETAYLPQKTCTMRERCKCPNKDMNLKFMSKDYSVNRPFIRDEFYFSDSDSSKDLDSSSYDGEKAKRSYEISLNVGKNKK